MYVGGLHANAVIYNDLSRRHTLDLGLRRWQIARLTLGAEPLPAVRPIAEGFILRHSTTTQRDHLPPAESEVGSFKVLNLKIPFDSNGTVP